MPGLDGSTLERKVRALVLRKWGDYKPVLPSATLQFLDLEAYLDAARADERVRDEMVMGWFADFERDFREPVLTDVGQELYDTARSLFDALGLSRLVDLG